MTPLERVKRVAEKATGWKRPGDPRALLRDRKPQTFRFKDDGLIPNHPKWPLVIYKSAVRLPQPLDPTAVFEELFESGAYPPSGMYDECTSPEDRENALTTIPKVGPPRKDPVYGAKGPLMRTWRKPGPRAAKKPRAAAARAGAHQWLKDGTRPMPLPSPPCSENSDSGARCAAAIPSGRKPMRGRRTIFLP
jgi:hypothetical protein